MADREPSAGGETPTTATARVLVAAVWLVGLAGSCSDEPTVSGPGPAAGGSSERRGDPAAPRTPARTADDAARSVPAFDVARPLLRLTVVPASAVEPADAADAPLRRDDLVGTVTVLVLERDEQPLGPLRRSEVRAWGRTDEELFAIARQNTRNDTAGIEMESQPSDTSGMLIVLSAEANDAASHALCLDAYPEAIGRHGAIVAVPRRTTLLAVPVEDEKILRTVPRLSRFAAQLFQTASEPITDRIYWWSRERGFVHIPIAEHDGELEITTPQPLLGLFAELGRDMVDRARAEADALDAEQDQDRDRDQGKSEDKSGGQKKK